MPKTTLLLFTTMTLSGCATVQETNYAMYEKRLQLQSYILGEEFKPVPQKAKHTAVRRITSQQANICYAPNNRNNRVISP